MTRLHALVLVLAPAAMLAVACSSSDTGGGSGGGSSTTTTTAATTGSGGGSTTSTTAATTGSGGAGGESPATTSASGTGGGTADGACTNAEDTAVLGTVDIQTIAGDCGQQNLGMEPATHDCIVTQSGLSDACATCFSDEVDCTVMHCLAQCISDPSSQACVDCRATNCDPAFEACSGLSVN